jgi:hypothetical protein
VRWSSRGPVLAPDLLQRQDETTPRAILAPGVAGPGYRARYPGIKVCRGAPPGTPFSYFVPSCTYLIGGFFISERSGTTSDEGRPYTAKQLIGAWPSFWMSWLKLGTSVFT